MASGAYYDTYAPFVAKICDRVYAQTGDATIGRNAYHRLGAALMESLLPVNEQSETMRQAPCGASTNSGGVMMSSTSPPTTETLPQFLDVDLVNFRLDDIHVSKDLVAPMTTQDSSMTLGLDLDFRTAGDSCPSWSAQESPQAQSPVAKAEADASCELCGYRPKGDPQWFRGSMAKHKKLQHSDNPPKVYKCPFPGCKSSFQKRPDNLRQHQIEKNHFVGEEAASRRPSKRKRQTSPAPTDP
jgi:hypothetical protein